MEGGPGSRARQGALIAGCALAAGATGVLLLSGDTRLLRFGVLAALWAALIGAYLATRYRKYAEEARGSAEDAHATYERELEREVAARKQRELEFELATRREVDADSRAELDRLRSEVEALQQSLRQFMDGEVFYERIALTAQATRKRAAGDDVRAFDRNGFDALDSGKPDRFAEASPRPAEQAEAQTELIGRVFDPGEVARDGPRGSQRDGPRDNQRDTHSVDAHAYPKRQQAPAHAPAQSRTHPPAHVATPDAAYPASSRVGAGDVSASGGGRRHREQPSGQPRPERAQNHPRQDSSLQDGRQHAGRQQDRAQQDRLQQERVGRQGQQRSPQEAQQGRPPPQARQGRHQDQQEQPAPDRRQPPRHEVAEGVTQWPTRTVNGARPTPSNDREQAGDDPQRATGHSSDAEPDSGSHSAGRPVSELLASYGDMGVPRRRRRRQE